MGLDSGDGGRGQLIGGLQVGGGSRPPHPGIALGREDGAAPIQPPGSMAARRAGHARFRGRGGGPCSSTQGCRRRRGRQGGRLSLLRRNAPSSSAVCSGSLPRSSCQRAGRGAERRGPRRRRRLINMDDSEGWGEGAPSPSHGWRQDPTAVPSSRGSRLFLRSAPPPPPSIPALSSLPGDPRRHHLDSHRPPSPPPSRRAPGGHLALALLCSFMLQPPIVHLHTCWPRRHPPMSPYAATSIAALAHPSTLGVWPIHSHRAFRSFVRSFLSFFLVS